MDPFGGYFNPYGLGESMDVFGSPIPAQQNPVPGFSEFLGPIGTPELGPPPNPIMPPQMPMPQQGPMGPMGPPQYDQFDFSPTWKNMSNPLMQAGAALLGSGGRDFGGALGAFGQGVGQERAIGRKAHETDFSRRLADWKIDHGLGREEIEDQRYEADLERDLDDRERNREIQDEDRKIRQDRLDREKEEREDSELADLDYIRKHGGEQAAADTFLKGAAHAEDLRAQLELEQTRKQQKADFEWELRTRKQMEKDYKDDDIKVSDSLLRQVQSSGMEEYIPPTTVPDEVQAIPDPQLKAKAWEEYQAKHLESEKAKWEDRGYNYNSDEKGNVYFSPDLESSYAEARRMQKKGSGQPLQADDFSQSEKKQMLLHFQADPKGAINMWIDEGLQQDEIEKMVDDLNSMWSRNP